MRRPKMQLRDSQLNSFFRFLSTYPEDWQREIINRCCDEPFPPFEFWQGIQHTHQLHFERMVARGIMAWIERQEEWLQDFVLDLLDNDFHHNADPDTDEFFFKVCLSIWGWMSPHDWLKRHAVYTTPKSQLWYRAILHVHYAIIWDEWESLRNYKPQFFISEEASDG